MKIFMNPDADKMIRTFCLTVLFLFVFNAPAQGAAVNMRPKLALAPLLPKNVEAVGFAESLSSLLYDSIDRTGFFETIERRKIETQIELEGLRIDSLTTADLFRIGRRAGLDFLIYGNARLTDRGVAVEVELLNVRENRSSYRETLMTEGYDISTGVKKIAQDIASNARETIMGRRNSVTRNALVPKSLAATGSTDRVKLRWQVPDSSRSVSFRVFRGLRENGPFVQIATSVEPEYTDSGLSVNGSFFYRVKTVGANGEESDFSTAVMGKTVVVPHPPILLSVEPVVKGARLSWRPRPVVGEDKKLSVAGFKIYRRMAGDSQYREVAQCLKEETSFRDKLKEGFIYECALTSFNDERMESEISTPLDVTPVVPVSGFNVNRVQKRYVTLQWNDSANGDVTGYAIYRSDRKDDGYVLIEKVVGRSTISYLDLGPEASKTYWYRIAAFNSEGDQTVQSEAVSATTSGRLPIPDKFSAVGHPTKVTLNWLPAGVPDDDIRGYHIYRSEKEKGSYQKIASVPSDVVSYVDRGLLHNNAGYFYRISSYDSTGYESEQSEPAVAETKDDPKLAASGSI